MSRRYSPGDRASAWSSERKSPGARSSGTVQIKRGIRLDNSPADDWFSPESDVLWDIRQASVAPRECAGFGRPGCGSERTPKLSNPRQAGGLHQPAGNQVTCRECLPKRLLRMWKTPRRPRCPACRASGRRRSWLNFLQQSSEVSEAFAPEDAVAKATADQSTCSAFAVAQVRRQGQSSGDVGFSINVRFGSALRRGVRGFGGRDLAGLHQLLEAAKLAAGLDFRLFLEVLRGQLSKVAAGGA